MCRQNMTFLNGATDVTHAVNNLCVLSLSGACVITSLSMLAWAVSDWILKVTFARRNAYRPSCKVTVNS